MGLWCALAAYLWWGLAPIYWKWLAGVPPLALIAHRVVWALPLTLLLIVLRGRLPAFRGVWRNPRLWRWHAAAAGLLAINWFSFVWAILNNRVLEVSFGYFVCPLLSVLLGRFVEGERLRLLQWAAIGCALVGVGVLGLRAEHFPLAGLLMAGSWATYGLIKKRTTLGSLSSLGVETSLLLLPALVYLSWSGPQVPFSLDGGPVRDWLLVIATGVVTTVPLLLFAEAARRVRLSTIGFLQYLVPSMNFGLAVMVFREPFTWVQGIAFGAIWIGLALYAIGRPRAVARATPPVPESPGKSDHPPSPISPHGP